EGVDTRLVAFVAPQPGREPGVLALRRHSAQHLPRYMVADEVHIVPGLPRTHNGKIDRLTLATQAARRRAPRCIPLTAWRQAVGSDEGNRDMSRDQVAARITAFIRESFLDGDPKGELEETSPLLEWEVLNSMNSALLLNFLRDELGAAVPLAKINAAN